MVRDCESHRIRGWQELPLSRTSEFTRDRRSDLDFNALIRGPADMCAAPPDRTYDRSRPNRSGEKSACHEAVHICLIGADAGQWTNKDGLRMILSARQFV